MIVHQMDIAWMNLIKVKEAYLVHIHNFFSIWCIFQVPLSRQGSKRLTKGDLPRRVRSPRTLSACNEQIFKFEQDIQSQTLDVQQINKALIKRDSQKSIQLEPPPTTSASASAKAVSCEALPSENKNPSSSKPSKTQKSAQVIFSKRSFAIWAKNQFNIFFAKGIIQWHHYSSSLLSYDWNQIAFSICGHFWKQKVQFFFWTKIL